MQNKIQYFTDLEVWKRAHELTLLTYKLTDEFPKEEKYALTDQIRRAVVSIESNIAEGFSRIGKLGKRQFYSIAKGSLAEVECQILIAKDLGYFGEVDPQKMGELIIEIGKMLTGILKSINRR